MQDARRRLWQPMPSLPDLDALNVWLEKRCIAGWGQIVHGSLPGTVADVHAEEVASLMPPGRPFDGFVEHTKRVSPTCLVTFERNRYSVPASFANRPVPLRSYPDRIVIAAEGRILCEHERILSQLLKAEMSKREVRSIAYQIKAARCPAYKDLAGFDFASSEVNEALVRQLHRGEFIDGAHKGVALGGPSTGKTHIATALGVQAVEHHRKKYRSSPQSIWSICWSR